MILASGPFGSGSYAAITPAQGNLAVVPEGNTLALLAAGWLGLLFWCRRTNRSIRGTMRLHYLLPDIRHCGLLTDDRQSTILYT